MVLWVKIKPLDQIVFSLNITLKVLMLPSISQTSHLRIQQWIAGNTKGVIKSA